MKRFLLCLTLCVCSAVLAGAFPAERIERFYSSAAVKEDASVTVTETVVVRANGDKIRRGIFRVLPYKGVSDYQIVSVSRGGNGEPYSVQESSSGKTVYIGDANRILSPGVYTYELKYLVKGAVRFQKDFDEFYWNVTGNDWQLPIDAAYFRLSLPAGAEVVPGGVSLYTGVAGAKDQNARELKELFFVTTRPLSAGEGLTVSVAWNKGIVREPFSWKRFFPVILLVLWLLLLVYCWRTWNKVGKDPKARILRRFTPPEGLSPAQVCYMRSMERNGQIFSVVLLSLVQKGWVKAERTGKYDFKLTRLTPPDGSELSLEEQACWEVLFNKEDSLLVDNAFVNIFREAESAVYNALEQWAGKRFFSHNTDYNWPVYLFVGIWLLFLVFCVPMHPFANGEISIIVIIALAVLNIILIRLKVCKRCWFTLLSTLCWLYGLQWGVLSLVAFAPGIIFFWVIPAYTPLGRKKMDEIEGFLQYLEVAETNRVFASNPTDAARIYCNYLPYAVALGVQNEWWNALAAELGSAAAERAVEVELGGVGVSDSLMSFTSALSAASIPPSDSSSGLSSSSDSDSDSGFGGGGCSGGGSGGGGGGGW